MFMLRPSAERGYANHGWLQSHHSFSFARYIDRQHQHFGALRVINDDVIAAGFGFDQHPHDNMEIITYVLHGALTHEDSMGHRDHIQADQWQYMRAGSGVWHSEYNHGALPCHLLQIWITPSSRQAAPEYAKQTTHAIELNELGHQLIAAPQCAKHPNAFALLANTYLWLGHYRPNQPIIYHVQGSSRMIYIHVIEGSIQIAAHMLHAGDALMMTDIKALAILTNHGARYLLFDLEASD